MPAADVNGARFQSGSAAKLKAEYVGASVPERSHEVTVSPGVNAPGQRTTVPAWWVTSKWNEARREGSSSQGPNLSQPPTQLSR